MILSNVYLFLRIIIVLQTSKRCFFIQHPPQLKSSMESQIIISHVHIHTALWNFLLSIFFLNSVLLEPFALKLIQEQVTLKGKKVVNRLAFVLKNVLFQVYSSWGFWRLLFFKIDRCSFSSLILFWNNVVFVHPIVFYTWSGQIRWWNSYVIYIQKQISYIFPCSYLPLTWTSGFIWFLSGLCIHIPFWERQLLYLSGVVITTIILNTMKAFLRIVYRVT